jgi:uncharacterized protein (TIGR03437 family)
MDPANPLRLLFGTQKLYESTDGGGHWTAISDDLTNLVGNIRSIAVAPSDPRVLWVGTVQGLVQVTTNSNETANVQWQNRSQGLPQNRIATQIAAHPTDSRTVYVAFAGFGGVPNQAAGHIFKTSDLGETWTDVSSDLPNIPVNDLLIDPDQHDTLYAATDAGVYRSQDAGTSWQPLGEGLPRVVVMGVKMQRKARILRAGTHGRGMWDLHLPLANNSAPRIMSLTPDSVDAQAAGFTLAVKGENFTSGSTVRWKGAERPTTFVSSTELRASIPGSDLRNPGRNAVAVFVPGNGGGLSNLVNLNVGAGPALTTRGVINPASGASGIVSGSLATIVGTNLASEEVLAGEGTLPFTLGGAIVEMDGSPVQLSYVSPTQIHFQIPWVYAQYGAARVSTSRDGGGSTGLIDVTIRSYQPGIFSINGQGTGQGAVVIEEANGALAAPVGAYGNSRPARVGDTLVLYATGLGPVTRQPATGQPPPAGSPSLTEPPIVRIGNIPVPVVFSGLAPGLIGVYRVDIRVIDGAPTGSAVPLSMTIGGAESNTVTIAVE